MNIVSIASLVVSCLCLAVLGYIVFVQSKKQTQQTNIDIDAITKNIEGVVATQKELNMSLNQMMLSTIKDNNDTLISTISSPLF